MGWLKRLFGVGRFTPTYDTYECDCVHPSWKHDCQGGCGVEGCDCVYGIPLTYVIKKPEDENNFLIGMKLELA